MGMQATLLSVISSKTSMKQSAIAGDSGRPVATWGGTKRGPCGTAWHFLQLIFWESAIGTVLKRQTSILTRMSFGWTRRVPRCGYNPQNSSCNAGNLLSLRFIRCCIIAAIHAELLITKRTINRLNSKFYIKRAWCVKNKRRLSSWSYPRHTHTHTHTHTQSRSIAVQWLRFYWGIPEPHWDLYEQQDGTQCHPHGDPGDTAAKRPHLHCSNLHRPHRVRTCLARCIRKELTTAEHVYNHTHTVRLYILY